MLLDHDLEAVLLRFPLRDEEIAFPRDGEIFCLWVYRAGEDSVTTVSAETFGKPQRRDSEAGLTLVFDDGGPLRVTVCFRPCEAEVLGTLVVENSDAGLTIKRVQFPYVAYDRVNALDRLLMASSWGDDIAKPTRAIRHYCEGRDKGFWTYDYVRAGEDEISYAYPSIMAMQFMVLHNPGRALYLACYGLGDDTRTFNAQLHGRDGLTLSINHYPFAAGGRWESPECALAVLPGGWHAAADVYAGHMRDRFSVPDIPKWMRDEDEGFHGWVQSFMRHEGQPPILRFGDLPDLARRARAVGLEGLHIAGWTYDGFDTYYPDFEPDPQLGTEEEMRVALSQMRAEGTRAILYTNGRLVDPRSRFYQAGGKASVCLGEDGQPYVERYGTSAEFRIACPSCRNYADTMAKQISGLITRYGAHAAQVDQISCNHAHLCYDPTHPHPTPATNYLPGIEQELRAIRAAHHVLDPEFYVWCEGCHERFAQFYDVNQGHGEEFTWALGEGVPELFSYVYPDYIVTGLSSNLQQLCHSYAQGKPFDVPLRMLDDTDYAELLRDFVGIRKQYASFFLKGRFIDSRGLDTIGDVRAFGIEGRDDGRLLVSLWLPGAEPTMVVDTVLRVDRAGSCPVRVYPDDLSIVPVEGWLTLSWRGPVATLIV